MASEMVAQPVQRMQVKKDSTTNSGVSGCAAWWSEELLESSFAEESSVVCRCSKSLLCELKGQLLWEIKEFLVGIKPFDLKRNKME